MLLLFYHLFSPSPSISLSRSHRPCARSSVAPQVSSAKGSAPQWAFGTGQRWMSSAKSSGSVPGPGTYELHTSVGTQVSSKKGSSPIYGFGSSTRDHMEKVFIAEEHNKSL